MARLLFSTLLAALATLGSAQYEGWTENQVNASICLWAQPRAGVIRDTVYLDGGYIYWSQGLSNGEYGPIDQPNNPLGLMYTLNFSQPFDLSQNLTALFGTISKARGGTGNANSDAPNFLDGAMLVNDAQLALYGGLVKKTDAFDPPREDEVLVYQQYYYNRQERGSWNPGFNTERLPDDLTRYIAFGGAASAPSENKAWYFGGMRSPNWGPIFQRTSNITENPVNASNTLITLDMRDQLNLEWTNTTLPDDIKGRANPELVWVPVGEEGILVAIGGVTYPDWVTSSRLSENAAQSKEESDEFMAVIDIYDVASGNWYRQRTVDSPTARTRGCAVVAPAQDSSSFNIYYYGGYPGVDPKDDFYDDVWVLSIPSFTWTRVSEGRPNHGRAGHKCFMPYPDQMMVIGGDTPRPGTGLACLDGGIIQLFNLTSAEWMDEYHPEKYSDYGVPSAVRSVIGGEATGGATLTTPSPSGWRDDELADIFDTPYETSKIQTWYPYAAATESSRPTIPDDAIDEDEDNDDDDDDDDSGGGGLPAWVAPTLGVVLGLVAVTAVLVAFCLWRKRKFLKQRGDTEASTDENGRRVLSWIRGQPTEAKALTVTTETPSNLDMTEVSSTMGPITSPTVVTAPAAQPAPAPTPSRFEMMDTSIAELPDTSRPPELQDTGLTPVEIINKHTHFAGQPQSSGNQSYLGSISGNEASSLSPSSPPLEMDSGSHTPSIHPSSVGPSTPPVPATGHESQGRVLSGVSGLSERDARHLRNISEVTVSSATVTDDEHSSSGPGLSPAAAAFARPVDPPRSVPTAMSGPSHTDSANEPLRPPTATMGNDSDEEMSANRPLISPSWTNTGAPSPLKKSVFKENEDDMGGPK